MLRLWPKRIRAGLFPGASWVHRSAQLLPVQLAGASDADLLAALDLLAAQCRREAGAGATVELLLSDSLARHVVLPWQDEPLNEAQRYAYAEACLDRAGVDVSSGWTVHSGFRHFGSPGLAVAIPTTWLDNASNVLLSHGVRLQRVTSATASVYWTGSGLFSRAPDLLLLAEPWRLTALRYDHNRFASLDVESVGTDVSLALRRMLNRVCAHHTTKSVDFWEAKQGLISEAVITARCVEARVRRLNTRIWSK